MIPLDEVAEELGLQFAEEKNGENVYFCDLCDDESPDLWIGSGKFMCFGGGSTEGGRKAISLVMHVKDWKSKGRAMKWLKQHFPDEFGEVSEEEIDRREKALEVLNKAALFSQARLKVEGNILENFLESRNFEEEDIDKARIGILDKEVIAKLKEEFGNQALQDAGLFTEDGYCILQDRLVFPHQEGETVWYMAGRALNEDLEPKYKKAAQTDYNENVLYQFFEDSDTLVITEGYTDAISAVKAGFSVVSPATTTFSDEQIEDMVRTGQDFDEVVIINDGDEAGEDGATRTARVLSFNGVDPVMVELPEEEDLDDWTSENGYEEDDIDELIESSDTYLDRVIEEADTDNRKKRSEKVDEVLHLIKDRSSVEVDQILTELPGKKDALQERLDEIREEESAEKAEDNLSIKKSDTDPHTIEIGSEEIELTPLSDIHIQEHRKTLTSLRASEQGLSAQQNYKLFQFSFGEGVDEEEFWLISNPDQHLNLGEKTLPLQKVDLTEEPYRDAFREEFDRLRSRGEVEGSFEDFIQDYSPCFRAAKRLTEESQQKIKNLSNDEVLQVVNEYIDNGFDIDPKLQQVLYPKLIHHRKQNVRPENVAPFAPHSIVYTNTKTGKSFTSSRIGERRDKVTSSGLIGYADADTTSGNKGILAGMEQNFFADELSSKNHEGKLNDRLLTLMERGEAAISQAAVDMVTEYYGGLTYLGNPVSSQDNVSFNEKFFRIIEDLGDNSQAMGSRFGNILVDMDLKEAKGQSLERDRQIGLESIVEWIKEEVADEYSKIEREMKPWLEQKYPETYRKDVAKVLQRVRGQKLNEFWESHLESYRHARGHALRMAVLENIGRVLSGEYDVEDIQRDADEAFKEVQAINISSLDKMALKEREDVNQERKKALLEGQEPKYVRYFVKSVVGFYNQGNDVGKYRSFGRLKDVWLDLREDMEEINESGKYHRWSPIQKNIADNRTSKQNLLKRRYGIWISEEDGELLFKVSDMSTFQLYTSRDEDSGGDEGNGGDAERSELRSLLRARTFERIACRNCGQVQTKYSKYQLCDECGNILSKQNIRGVSATPQLKNAGGDTAKPQDKESAGNSATPENEDAEGDSK